MESLLVFSDVHLGSDLNDRAGPERTLRRSEDIDRDLVSFLAHYRDEAPGDRWRLVIAGDFIDFIGMSVDADAPVTTTLTEEEHEHGLGSAADHACAKLRRVARRHADVFAALAAFVAHGHALTLVHGNHDVEFHWDEVKEDFRAHLLSHVEASVDREAFLARIDFCPWFFRWNGIAYVEHGHQYDVFCATDHIMAPLSPLDPRRVVRGFCDVLLRFVVRPTIGMTEHGHETRGMIDYLAFGMQLGIGGMVRLGVCFVRAIIELFRLRHAHFSRAARLLRMKHHRRVALFARAARISTKRLRALLALQAPPITRSVRGILKSLLLDRLGVALLATLALAVSVVLGAYDPRFFFASAGIACAWFLAHRYLAGQRTLDPAEVMAERATHLARLLPAAFIVMGHTHAPRVLPVNDGASTYINLGSWSEDEPAAGKTAYRATRTHLVIQMRDGAPVAELRAWEPTGPRRFVAPRNIAG
jgi:UDP-2,3-diacylglucosamine pyrophosphatase LpxH